IGGTAAGAGNVISGNGGTGIQTGNSTQITGNIIGLNAAGTAALGNAGNGIGAYDAPNLTIGGTDPAARNIISANGNNDWGDGINIYSDSNSTGIVIQGNFVGTNKDGNSAF